MEDDYGYELYKLIRDVTLLLEKNVKRVEREKWYKLSFDVLVMDCGTVIIDNQSITELVCDAH